MAQHVLEQSPLVRLGEMCRLAYEQRRDGGAFTPPAGYEVVEGLKCNMPGRDEWIGFVARSEKDAVVAFCGTSRDVEFMAEGIAVQAPFTYAESGGKVHAGFLMLYESCRDAILRALASLPSDLPLHVTGHSLGGALATLHALDRADHSKRATSVCTFGSPRVGDPDFVDAFAARIASSVRVVNVHDLVPNLPPAQIIPDMPLPENAAPLAGIAPHLPMRATDEMCRYGHVPHARFVNLDKGGIPENHAMETYAEAVSRA